MPEIQGYYNTKNDTFLGTMHTDTGYTPRFVEGVCWGTFNTDTEEFVPLSNPMVANGVITFDEDPKTGKTSVTGISEDVGADIVSKGSIQIKTDWTEVKPFGGTPLEERKKQIIESNPIVDEIKEEPVVKNDPINTIEDLPKLDLEKLF